MTAGNQNGKRRKARTTEPAKAIRDPTPAEDAMLDKAKERQEARPVRSSVDLKRTRDGALTITNPHTRASDWSTALREVFASSSPDFAADSMSKLGAVRRRTGKDGEAVETVGTGFNADLALIAGFDPQNEAEAAIAVQFVICHNASASLLARGVQNADAGYVEAAAAYTGMAAKLSRALVGYVEALAKLRGGGKQQVEVKHVYVNGNAVVGNVTTGGGGAAENRTQPHAPGLEFAPGEAMPCAVETDRAAMPSAGGAREGALSNARRR
jgi:hypothetical protein